MRAGRVHRLAAVISGRPDDCAFPSGLPGSRRREAFALRCGFPPFDDARMRFDARFYWSRSCSSSSISRSRSCFHGRSFPATLAPSESLVDDVIPGACSPSDSYTNGTKERWNGTERQLDRRADLFSPLTATRSAPRTGLRLDQRRTGRQGFLVTTTDDLIQWARTGLADVDDVRPCLLRCQMMQLSMPRSTLSGSASRRAGVRVSRMS